MVRRLVKSAAARCWHTSFPVKGQMMVCHRSRRGWALPDCRYSKSAASGEKCRFSLLAHLLVWSKVGCQRSIAAGGDGLSPTVTARVTQRLVRAASRCGHTSFPVKGQCRYSVAADRDEIPGLPSQNARLLVKSAALAASTPPFRLKYHKLSFSLPFLL